MELFDTTKINDYIKDYRYEEKSFMEFYENCIKKYLDGAFLEVKRVYLEHDIHVINYSTIYKELAIRFIIANPDPYGINDNSVKNSENICMIILNKFLPIYKLSGTQDKNPYVAGYEYIFISLTTGDKI